MAFERLGVQMVVQGVAQFSRDIGYVVAGYLRYERSLASLQSRINQLNATEIRTANQRVNTLVRSTNQIVAALTKEEQVRTKLAQVMLKSLAANDPRAFAAAQNAYAESLQRTSDMNQELTDTTGRLFGAIQQQEQAEAAAEARTQAFQQSYQGLGGVLNALTGGFGRNIVLTNGLGDALGLLNPQIAAFSMILNVVKLGLDAFVFASRIVIGVVNALWSVFTKFVAILIDVGKWILNIAVNIGKTLLTGLWKLVTFPFAMVKAGFDSIKGALGNIMTIILGMTASNLIINLGFQFRQLAGDTIETAKDFQLLKIQLQGLIANEIVSTSEAAASAKIVKNYTAEESSARWKLQFQIKQQQTSIEKLTAKYGESNIRVTEAKGILADLQKQFDATTKTFSNARPTVISFADAMDMAKDKASTLFTWIAKLALQSPLTVEGVNEMLFMSIAYGNTTEEAKKLTEATVQYSAAIGLENEKAQNIILNIGQMRTAGKVTGMAIRNLARDMVPVGKILQMMGDRFGKTKGAIQTMAASGTFLGKEIKDLTDEDLVPLDAALEGMPVEEFQNAWENLVAQNYPGALGRMATSMKVAAENAQDLVNVMVGMDFLGPIMDVLGTRLNNFINTIFTDQNRQMFRDWGNTIATTMDKAMNAVDGLGKVLWEGFISPMGTIIGKNLMNVWNGTVKNDTFGKLGKALFPISNMFTKIFNALNQGWTTTQILSSLAVSSDSFSAAVGGIGMALLRGDIEGAKTKFQDLWKVMGDIATQVWNVLQPALQDLWNNTLQPYLAKAKAWVLDTIANGIQWLEQQLAIYVPKIADWLNVTLANAFQALGLNSDTAKRVLGDIQGIIKDIATLVSGGNLLPKGIYEAGGQKTGTRLKAPTAQMAAQSDMFSKMADLANIAKTAVGQLFDKMLALVGLDPTKVEDLLNTIRLTVEFVGAEATGAMGLINIIDALVRLVGVANQLVSLPKNIINEVLYGPGGQPAKGPGVIDAFKNVGDWLKAGGDAAQNFVTGLSTSLTTFQTNAVTSINNLMDALKTAVGIKGPELVAIFMAFLSGDSSSVYSAFYLLYNMLIGKSLIPEMMQGIQDEITTKLGELTGLIQPLIDATTNQFSTWSLGIIAIFQNISGEVSALSGKIANLIELMKEAAMGTWQQSSSSSSTGKTGTTLGGGSRTGPKVMGWGGDVVPSSRYIVGDKGPELFVPKYPGFILPNDSLGQLLRLVSSAVHTPMYSRGNYTNNSSQMNFYGPQYFSVPSNIDMLTLFQGGT